MKNTDVISSEKSFVTDINEGTINSQNTTIPNYEDIKDIIRSILVTRVREGATIQEIKDDYYDITGHKLPIKENITDFLLSIPHVMCHVNKDQCRLFFIKSSEKSQHIINMIKNQKPPRYLSKGQSSSFLPVHKTIHNSKSQYQKNLNHYHQNFVNSNNYKNDFYRQNSNFKDNYKTYNNFFPYRMHRQENQFYDSDNDIANDNLRTSCQFGILNERNFDSRMKQRQLYEPNRYQQHYDTVRRSTPINENYNHETNVNKIADYIARNNFENDICFFEDNYNYLSRKFTGSNTDTFSTKRMSLNPDSSYSNQDFEMMRNFNNPFQKKFNFKKYNVNKNHNDNYMNNNFFYDEEKQYMEDVAHIHDYQLLGDDFFLAMARAEIGCKYKRGNLRRQSGLCVSGQTLKEAVFRIMNEENIHHKIIVNLGSVDILQEHFFIDIQQDFISLLKAFKKRNIHPILTTLAPLANIGHKPEIKRTLECFNELIRKSGFPYIDIWEVMVNQHGETYYDCYQSGAKYVSGSILPHVLWNNVGRQRILNKIKSELPFIDNLDFMKLDIN